MALATAEPLVSKHLSTLESRINVALRLIFFNFFLGQNKEEVRLFKRICLYSLE